MCSTKIGGGGARCPREAISICVYHVINNFIAYLADTRTKIASATRKYYGIRYEKI